MKKYEIDTILATEPPDDDLEVLLDTAEELGGDDFFDVAVKALFLRVKRALEGRSLFSEKSYWTGDTILMTTPHVFHDTMMEESGDRNLVVECYMQPQPSRKINLYIMFVRTDGGVYLVNDYDSSKPVGNVLQRKTKAVFREIRKHFIPGPGEPGHKRAR